MLKVECESCRAPYQIDERRVPPTGLKMRCPKCGHSFMVTNGGAVKPAEATKPVVRPTRPEGVRAQKTMVGIAPPSPAASPAAPPRPAPLQPPAPQSPLPSDFPAALGSLDEMDLPVVQSGADLPAPRADLPAARRAPPPPRAAVPAAAARAPVADPMAFGEVDLPAVQADLPAPRAELPAPKASAQQAGTRPPGRAGGPFDIDLPVVSAELPAAKRAVTKDYGDLPVVAADLPAVAAGLPAVSAGLPAISAGLPSVSAGLPATAQSLPSVAQSLPSVAQSLPSVAQTLPNVKNRGFGEIDLPHVAESLPSMPDPHKHLPAAKAPGGGDPFGDFGELDLPREGPQGHAATGFTMPSTPPVAPQARSGAFGELDFEGSVARRAPTSDVMKTTGSVPPPAAGGVGFGEVDLGGGDDAASASPIATEAPIPTSPEPGTEAPTSFRAAEAGIGGAGGFEAPIAGAATKPTRERPVSKKKSGHAGKVVLLLVVLAILGGASLQLTPHGAFGYLTIMDMVKAKDYASAATAAAVAADKRLAVDTYDEAKAAIEDAANAHANMPRAKALTAYASAVESLVTVRYGADPSRGPRAKQWLEELGDGADVAYFPLAKAAAAAAAEDWGGARAALGEAGNGEPGDPTQLELALLRGQVEIRANDIPKALAAFQAAAKIAPQDARVHYGLARAAYAAHDADTARKEVDATLAASPSHAGALILRAALASASDEAAALKDAGTVIDALKAKASPAELAAAYAQRGLLNLGRGGTAEARTSFEEALKLNPQERVALLGQGELLYRENRLQEALARFDAAVKIAPDDVDAITSDVMVKVALGNLDDAKKQIVDANTRFPKTMNILAWLGKIELRLKNPAEAEKAFRAAIAVVEPTKADAIVPYLLLSALLTNNAKPAEAQKILDEAKSKLPDSAALQRAFGEVAEQQGKYDEAVVRYKASLAKDPKDIGTTFRLGVALRQVRDFEAASAELDKVMTADKDFPGLALERGVLFEARAAASRPDEHDKLMKIALDEFTRALQKTPDDPDLQLRVGACYVALNQPDKAIEVLKQVLLKRGRSADAHFYKGRALMELGPAKLSDALGELKLAVETDPTRAEYHLYFGWISNDAGQLGDAKAEIEKAIALDKRLPEAYWQRSLLECKQGAIVDGIIDAKHALELRPTLYQAHAALAACYNKKNDAAAEFAEWTLAVTQDKNQPEWRFHLGKLQLERGSVADAVVNLVYAADEGDRDVPRAWTSDALFLAGEALRKAGRKDEAIVKYTRYLKIAPAGSPDLGEARARLDELKRGR